MPFIWVELAEGRTVEQRRAFVTAVTEAAGAHLDAPPERVTIRFLDIKPSDFARGGKLMVDVLARAADSAEPESTPSVP